MNFKNQMRKLSTSDQNDIEVNDFNLMTVDCHLFTFFSQFKIFNYVKTFKLEVEWSNWSTCSSSCGEGIQKRIRYCSDFDIQHHLCDGNELKVQACKSDPCPGSFYIYQLP